MATTTSNVKPTSRQLAYLKALANRTGQTFTYPQTAAQASAEITRLKQATPSTGTERYVERKLIADQIAAGPIDSARVREDEIAGRGSSATWVHNREQDPPRRRIRAPPRRASAGHRWWARAPSWRATPCLTGPSGCSTAKRVDGSVRLTDRPAAAGGRAYLVERELYTKSELDALLADYLDQAAHHDRPPVAVCPLESSAETVA